MKSWYVVVHDYGMGSVARRVCAHSKEDIEALLTKPTWQVYSTDDPGCPDFKVHLGESDIDNPDDWLKMQIYILQRQAEGKRSFPVRGKKWGIVIEERNLWARSENEIRQRFPSLEFRYYVPWSCHRYADIDVNDDFILRYEKKDT